MIDRQRRLIRSWLLTHLKCRVPDHEFDILCVRVYHSHTLILVLLVNCKRQWVILLWNLQRCNLFKKDAHVCDGTDLPKPRHSCLGYMWPVAFLKVPMSHTWLRFHALLKSSNTVGTIKPLWETMNTNRYSILSWLDVHYPFTNHVDGK